MQKESLSVITVKMLLAVLLFAGIGTIIIGGGYIIGEYYKTNNKITKPINQETENYYDVLEKKCDNTHGGCCLSSLNIMKQGNYKEADQDGNCPDGFFMNMQKCITSYQWCEPIKEEIVCTQNVASDFLDDRIGNDPCDRLCKFDSDCKLECGCGCISKDENCEYTGIECERPNPDYGCQCVNQSCKYNYIGTDIDTSDWQTYRNEEFGFEMKHPKKITVEKFERVYSKGLSINFPSGSTLEYLVGPHYDAGGNKSNITVDNQDYNMWHQFFDGGELYRISLDPGREISFKNIGSSDDFELFNQILSTFKFTN